MPIGVLCYDGPTHCHLYSNCALPKRLTTTERRPWTMVCHRKEPRSALSLLLVGATHVVLRRRPFPL